MTVWIDTMLSPAFAFWMTDTCDGVEAYSLDYLNLRHARDEPIRAAALGAEAIVLTRNYRFAEAVRRDASQPLVLWVRVGNTSTAAMKVLLNARFPAALDAIRRGDRVVEFHEADACASLRGRSLSGRRGRRVPRRGAGTSRVHGGRGDLLRGSRQHGDAMRMWIETARALGRAVPAPERRHLPLARTRRRRR